MAPGPSKGGHGLAPAVRDPGCSAHLSLTVLQYRCLQPCEPGQSLDGHLAKNTDLGERPYE